MDMKLYFITCVYVIVLIDSFAAITFSNQQVNIFISNYYKYLLKFAVHEMFRFWKIKKSISREWLIGYRQGFV